MNSLTFLLYTCIHCDSMSSVFLRARDQGAGWICRADHFWILYLRISD